MRFTHNFRLNERFLSFVITIIALNALLVSCKKHNSDLRQQIIGTWAQQENSFVMTLDANGTFYSQYGTSNSIKQINYFGTWAVKSGSLQMTLTNIYARGVTNLEAVGNIDSFKIIQSDNSTLGFEYHGQNLFYHRK